ncbi:MAG: phosphatase PAP2 family protein [Bacteroidota bacterium]
MTFLSKQIPLLFLLTLMVARLSGQTISSIHPIEDIQAHYASLRALDDQPRKDFAWLDTIAYSPDLYRSGSLLYALMESHYLTATQVDFLINSVQFPANSSVQTRAELDYLLDLQAKRTPEEVERVLDLAKVGYWPATNFVPDHNSYQKNLEHLFYEGRVVMGNDCTAANYPLTTKLLKGVMHDMRLMEFAVKYHLFRARPYYLEPQLEPLQIMGSPSFASGHTLWAYIQAYTWSELIPTKRKAFVDLAFEIGHSREIMGVHYPSDEEAARQLAHRMLWLMWHTEQFQQDFRAAQAEWEE